MKTPVCLTFCLFFLYLSFLPGYGKVCAQNTVPELQKIALNSCRITFPKMSDNGRWIAVRKSYDDAGYDSVLIFNSLQTGLPVSRANVTGIQFAGNDRLLLQAGGRTELLDPEKQTSVFFGEVKKSQYLKRKKQFLLHYNEKEKNKLELYDIHGNLLNKTEQVTRFYTTGEGNIYAVRTNEHNESEIVRIRSGTKEKVYSTRSRIDYLEIDPGEKGMMIYERGPDHAFQEINHLNLEDLTVSPLKEVLPVNLQNGFSEVVQGKSIYFLKLLVGKEKNDTSLADIWYGNDHKLEEKFHPLTKELNYLWEPQKKLVQRIGNDQRTTNINLGNDRHFLSFNSWRLNDYRWSLPPLVIDVYCRYDSLYSQIDTIHSRLFVSGNGEYLLYTKKENWCLYRISTGTKKLIGGSDLKTPYFTSDSKSVLFEGNGGLWRYDLKNDKLTKLDDFTGYQTTLLNGTSDVIGNFRFYRNRIDSEKPFVVRLFDSAENKSTYVLWEKGANKTIVPTTTNRIQFLNYDDACKHFSYTEENYNLPPRLVYKETGKEESVLFESNKADKAILSLRQEIISYTNSEGVSLKGVLYYPLNYDPSRKYPVVVHVYEVQHCSANHYLSASFEKNGLGFDIRFLLGKGYFVYLPDIVYGEKGTGISALDCVNHALDALNNPSIDQSRIGLIGHSHGGYETNFIATRSTRFAAYISGAGNSDIVRSYFSFNYNFLSPFYWQYETGQYQMNKSFREDKELYFRNNPIYEVDQVNAPVLLWAGMKDKNIYWEQTMEFYIGLKRNNKKVVALFYPDEGHALMKTDTRRDLICRTLDWFDYFLKDQRKIGWINRETGEGAP